MRRESLAKTLVCHVEVEFAPVYDGEPLFADVDACLRQAGFCFVDFYNLGRQRYVSFESSPRRAFHRGRTLWGDCIYIRSLDDPDALTDDELFRTALIVHACYNKQDLAAELLRQDRRPQVPLGAGLACPHGAVTANGRQSGFASPYRAICAPQSARPHAEILSRGTDKIRPPRFQ